MKGFKQNCCRICPLVLCCVECRVKHEGEVHNVSFSDCDICVYGQGVIKEPSKRLLEHLKQVHFPLHCVHCKKIYTVCDDLINHSHCQGPYNEVPPTPTALIKMDNINDYSSPPLEQLTYKDGFLGGKLLSVDSKLTTSTPMQKVDGKTSGNCHSNISSLKKSSDVTNEKRKVTFCETPSFNFNTGEERNTKDALTGDNPAETPYYSTSEDVKDVKEPIQEKTGTPISTTLWETAMNTPATERRDEDIFKVTPIINKFTPISANLKKRKKNVNLAEALNEEDPNKENIPDVKNDIFVSTKLGASDINADIENSINESISEHKEALALCDSNHFWRRNEKSEEEISAIPSVSHDKETNENKEGIWSSVSRIMKNVRGFSNIAESLSNQLSKVSLKRSFSESEADHLNYLPKLKRSKYADIRGRRPIRDLNMPHSRYDSDPEIFQKSVDVSGEVPPKENHINKPTQTDL